MNVRSSVAAVLFGLSFAATPVFAAEPTPAPQPAKTQVQNTKPMKELKTVKGAKVHHPKLTKTAPAPTPQPSGK